MLRWLKNLLTKDKKESAKNGLSSSFVVDKQSTSEIDKIITVDNDQDALHTLGSVTSGRYFPECQNQTNRSCGDEHKRIEGNNVYRKSTEFSVKECGTKVSDRSIVNQNDSRTFAKETSLFQLSSQQVYCNHNQSTLQKTGEKRDIGTDISDNNNKEPGYMKVLRPARKKNCITDDKNEICNDILGRPENALKRKCKYEALGCEKIDLLLLQTNRYTSELVKGHQTFSQMHTESCMQRFEESLLNNATHSKSKRNFSLEPSDDAALCGKRSHYPVVLDIDNFSKTTTDSGSGAVRDDKLLHPANAQNKINVKVNSPPNTLNLQERDAIDYRCQNSQHFPTSFLQRDKINIAKQSHVCIEVEPDNTVIDNVLISENLHTPGREEIVTSIKEYIISSPVLHSEMAEATFSADGQRHTQMNNIGHSSKPATKPEEGTIPTTVNNHNDSSTCVMQTKCDMGDHCVNIISPKSSSNTSVPANDMTKQVLVQGEDNYTDLSMHSSSEQGPKAVNTAKAKITNFSENICSLYNQEGEIYSIGNQRYIRTVLTNGNKLVYVHISPREIPKRGTKMGCRVLWRGQTPIPLSTMREYSKVKFDAIYIPEHKVFHALVIWEYGKNKPTIATEPTSRSYIWIDSRVLACDMIDFEVNKGFVWVCYDKLKIKVKFTEKVVFINGKKSSFTALKAHRSKSTEPIYSTICRLMTGKKDKFVYVCVCIWSGERPPRHCLPLNQFKRGEVYQLNSENTFVAHSNPSRLYCDWPVTLHVTANGCHIEFEADSCKVSQPASADVLYTGSYRFKLSHPLIAQGKAHIQMVSKVCWIVLYCQLISNEKDPAKTSTEKALEPDKDEKGKCNVTTQNVPEKNTALTSTSHMLNKKQSQFKNTLSSDGQFKYTVPSHGLLKNTVPSDGLLKNTVPSDGLLRNTVPSHSQLKNTLPSHGQLKNKLPHVQKNSKFYITDVSGSLMYIKGDYGILKVRHRKFIGQEATLVSFHCSVAYVNRWPFYKDVVFKEQIDNLTSDVWHCSIKCYDHMVDDLHLKFAAVLAWQGWKPTKEDIKYFETVPADSDIYYYASNVEYGKWDNSTSESVESPLPPANARLQANTVCRSEKDGTTYSAPRKELLCDETKYYTIEDIDLFPTIASRDGRETVEVRFSDSYLLLLLAKTLNSG